MGSNMPKPIPLQLDKDRNLYITLGAMWEFEQTTGKSMEDMDEGSINDILQFLACAMKKDDPDVKIEDFMHYIHDGNMNEIFEKIGQVMEEVNGVEKPTNKGKQQKKGKDHAKNRKRSAG